jgi:hypothetical protein
MRALILDYPFLHESADQVTDLIYDHNLDEEPQAESQEDERGGYNQQKPRVEADPGLNRQLERYYNKKQVEENRHAVPGRITIDELWDALAEEPLFDLAQAFARLPDSGIPLGPPQAARHGQPSPPRNWRQPDDSSRTRWLG